MYIKEAAIEMEINLSKKEKRLKHQELIELYYSVIVCKMVTQTLKIFVQTTLLSKSRVQEQQVRNLNNFLLTTAKTKQLFLTI